MSTVRVKICGFTRIDDALFACEAGADAIGLNFWPGSKRRCDLQVARQVVEALPPFVTPVALFVNAAVEEIRRVLGETGISVAQLHGDEPPEACAALGPRTIKAIRVAGPQWRADAERFGAHPLLLDTATPGYGGSGAAFDWGLVDPAAVTRPWILAGGLTPQNVGEAIRKLRPAAVDVASGVERSPGIKDPDKVAAFIRAAKEP